MDFNDAGRQQSGSFELIPEGTVAPVRMTVKGMKNSATGAVGLDVEYIITAGPYAKRKIFNGFLGIDGNGSEGHNKMVSISRSFIRAVLESAYGIDPADDSAAAMDARRLGAYEGLDGVEFVARVKVEQPKDYIDKETGEKKPGKAKNLVEAVTPDDEDYKGFTPAKKAKGAGVSKPANGTTAVSAPAGNRPAWA
jgi:hypothetical protein